MIRQAKSKRGGVERSRDHLPVISARMAAGRQLVRVYAEEQSGAKFSSVEPELEDVYFSRVRRAA